MDVLMPQLGETVAEGKITKWFKSAGDAIKPGDNLFEIETDKVSMEVPSTSAGVLAEIRIGAGEVAPVGAIVAVISASGAGASTVQAAKPAAAPASQARSTSSAALAPATVPAPARQQRTAPLDPFQAVRTPERNFGPARLAGGQSVTPLARRLAAEAGIDLAGVAASGPHGRIVARDVGAAVGTGAPMTSMAPVAPAARASADRVKALYEPGSYQEVPLDNMRRTIATRLVEAKQTIPHFYLTVDVTIDRLNEVREDTNAVAPRGEDGNPAFKLSL